MDRDEFMELVYETFADEPDNVLANGIIEAADAYVEHEKAKHSCKGTTSDTISRQAAINGKIVIQRANGVEIYSDEAVPVDYLKRLQPIQPEHVEGEWIFYDKRFPWRTWYKCSNCGNYLDFSGVNGGRGEVNFCPNCGANMKGKQT